MKTAGIPDAYKNCRLCPRDCGADRYTGRGVCGEGAEIRVARAAPHFWEEPCLSGERGSGTVFFTGCALHCQYCQNGSLSRSQVGRAVSPARLAEIFLELQEKGVHNINLVTASHFTPGAAQAICLAKARGLALPVVWNSSGYEKPETLRLLAGLVDVYLPDFKYAREAPAAQYSRAPDYARRAKAALEEMFRQVGPCRFDGDGMLQKGMLVRHLCLPGGTADSMAALEYLHRRFGDDIYISIMSQYTPQPGASGLLARRLEPAEYDAVVDRAIQLGIENGFTQEGEAAEESFIPAFDLEGV